MSPTPPCVLAVAGSDSAGGAGIQADLKTMLALGVHGMSVVCAVTAQNSVGVQGYWEVPPDVVRAQLASVLGDIGVHAVKTGMLASAAIVANGLQGTYLHARGIAQKPGGWSNARYNMEMGPPLLAPLLVTMVGGMGLLPLATVLTPNLLEAELLTGSRITDEAGMRRAAEVLSSLGPRWILVKGGHLPGNPVDLLFDGSEVTRFPGQRIASRHTHGTGCTLASACAAGLAQGLALEAAVARAWAYTAEAIRRAPGFGAGAGPLDHAWPLRDR